MARASSKGIRSRPGGVSFAVRLTPKGGRDRVEEWAVGADGRIHLKARVASPPEDGKANAALIALLSATLGVAKRAVRIMSGITSRMKTVEIDGDPEALIARLDALGESP